MGGSQTYEAFLHSLDFGIRVSVDRVQVDGERSIHER